MESELVTVIIPTYNRAQLVTEALDSVYGQTHRPIECIVVDDGSTDDTVEVVKKWKRARTGDDFCIRLLQQENHGAPAARNRGMEAARGDDLLFLDSDDQLTENALTALTHAQKRRDADVVYGDFVWIRDDGRQPTVQEQIPPSEHSIISVLQNCPRTSTALVESGVVGETRWREDLPCAQEFGFFLDLALSGATFERIDEVVLRALDHTGETRINNTYSYRTLMARTIGSYLLEVERDLRACGEEESAACDRALLYFSGLLASKGERSLAKRLLSRANRGRFVGRMCSELSIPGRFPLLVSLIGVRGAEAAFRTKRVLQDIFR
jgi:hypothetical protein